MTDIQDNLLPPSFPIFCVAEDLLCLYSTFSSFIQTTNSYQLLSYCYLPDNLKRSSIDPIPHKGAVLQTEWNRQVTSGGSTGSFQGMTKKDKNKGKER